MFRAKYDVWGKQTVTSNKIDLCYGYTGHKMLTQFGFINMNARLYDPTLGRFLSCDNYVQEPNNSQNFNRYSYCINNPLKYTDPSGNLFGIDDTAIAFAIYGIGSSMMQAAYNGENIWKVGALSLLSSAATYGIGQAFGATGTFWNELGRAGAHGLASGVTTALNGGNFASAFISGAASSGIGSFAQGVKLPTEAMLGCSTVMGGLTSWATGGNFLEGAMNGFQIGALNHALHDGDNDNVITLPDGTRVLSDGSIELNEVIVEGHQKKKLAHFRSPYVRVTFDKGADHPVAIGLGLYLNTVLRTASMNGIHSVNISSTSNHPSNASRSAHSVSNGSRAIDINYINGQHVSPQNELTRCLQTIIRNTPGYLENYGPYIINKVEKGRVFEAPWARKINGGHYDHIHISIPKKI